MISIRIFEIFMQMINFLLLLYLVNKFLIGPVSAFLEKRANTIKNDIDTAHNQKLESDRLLNERKNLLKASRFEAKEMKDKAELTIEKEKEVVLAAARKEANNIIDDANKNVELMVEKAKKDLSSEIGVLSVQLTEKILRKKIDQPAQQEIVSDSVQNLS